MPASVHSLFSPMTSRTVTPLPTDYISPATRRQRGVGAPSPALTMGLPVTALFDQAQSTTIGPVGTSMSTLLGGNETTLNDDEAEKKERKRSRVFELQRRNLDSPAGVDRRMSEPLSGLSNKQLTEHYTNCIKLSAENKITAKNAFGLHLIDYMSELLKKKEMNNFQVASSTLDASAKIYAGRVDAVHSETYKVLSGLGRGADRSKHRNEDDDEFGGDDGAAGADGDPQAAEQPAGKDKRRKRARKSHTIETNLKNLNVNKFDLEFEVDPLFSKTSAEFDEGGTGGLLLCNLRCLDDAGELVLDCSTVVSAPEYEDSARLAEAVRGASRLVDLSDFRALYSGVKLDNVRICPAFADFEFMNWNRDGEDVFSRLNSSQLDPAAANAAHPPTGSGDTPPGDSAHAFDLDAEVEPEPEVAMTTGQGGEGGGADFMDDFGGDDDAGSLCGGGSEGNRSVRDFCVGDGEAAKIFNKAMDDIKHGTVGTLMQVLAHEPSDYSYFKSSLLRTWAGPDHWKPAAKTKLGTTMLEGSTEPGERSRKTKDKRVDIFKLNYRESVDFDSLFKESRASTTLTKSTLEKYSQSQTTLPEDLHYDADRLFKLFEKSKLMIKRYDSSRGGATDDAEVQDYDFNNDNDRENYCPNSQQEDDDDDHEVGGFELTNLSDQVFTQDTTQAANLTALDGTLLGDRLLQQPRKVAKVDIAYAKAAKKVDIKKVKSTIWSILIKPDIASLKKNNPEGSTMDTDEQSHTTEEQAGAMEGQTGVCGQHSFQSLLQQMPEKVSRVLARNLSVPIAFVCLLHLANEKTLDISSDETMSDLIIKQG